MQPDQEFWITVSCEGDDLFQGYLAIEDGQVVLDIQYEGPDNLYPHSWEIERVLFDELDALIHDGLPFAEGEVDVDTLCLTVSWQLSPPYKPPL